MIETKSALIIANYQYQDPELRQLVTPAQDAESLARVLSNPAIGGFEVRTLINEPSHKVSLEIESFCDNRKRDDLLLVYFSGHGIKDADSQLYFATADTQLVQHNVRRSTAVSANFVNQVMSRSRSRRQILLLDCCYSGAFKEGMLAKGDQRVGAGEQLEGQGRVVLTASDALQYSFEGEQLQGEGIRSVFTSTLVHGLETGEADLDRDGCYGLDELYDYVHDRVADKHPQQKPMKMGYVEGKIFIGNNPHPRAAELPQELRDTLEHPLPLVRKGGVQELGKLLAASNKGLVLAAQAALQSLAKEDDSQQVRSEAQKYLAANIESQVEPSGPDAADVARRAQEEHARREHERLEAERLAAEKREAAERERLAREREEAARRAAWKAESEQLARDRAEAERAAQLKAEQERLAREKAVREEQAKRERDRLNADRLAAEKREAAESERRLREWTEAERAVQIEAEQERLNRERAAWEEVGGTKIPGPKKPGGRVLKLLGWLFFVLILIMAIRGCSQDDNEYFHEGKLQHPVKIAPGIWLGQTEVTPAAYEKLNGKPRKPSDRISIARRKR